MQLITQFLLCCVPILYFALSASVFSVALHCSNQTYRLYLLPFFITFSVLSFVTSKYFFYVFPSLISLWSLGISLYMLHVISLLFIERWPSPRSSCAKKRAAPNGVWNLNFRATYKLWGNPQLLPTAGTPGVDSSSEIPYSVFFFLRLVKLPIYYCLHSYVIPLIFSETVVEYFPEDVSPVQQILIRRLQDVTAREVIIRGYTAVIWILESLIYLDSANAVLACFFVIVGLDQPCEWPALFGSLSSATSLRKFWSRFWHRLPVRPYTNYGKVLAHGVRLRPGSFAFKTITACVVFILSGASHSAVSWQVGYHEWYLDIWWFFLNFLGCLIEVLWLSAVRRFAKSMKLSRELKLIEESWFGNFVGYTWVFAFFFWSTPKWRFPSIYRQALVVEKAKIYF